MTNNLPKRKIKFGLVGCGRISANHMAALDAHKETAEIVAVCDTNAAKLKAAMEKTGKPGYATLGDLLAKSDVEVVSIMTPSGLHAPLTIEAARAGRHVVVEKPMATTWEDGLEMVRTVDQTKTKLFVVLQNRKNETIQLLKKAIDQKRFGKIYLAIVNVLWTRPQSYYDEASWRGTWKYDGGAFMNQASHYVDLLTYLLGPLESVHAVTGTLGRNIETEDTGVMVIKWASGTMGSLNVTMLTHKKNLEGSITILGEKGTVKVGGVAVNDIRMWEFETPHEDDLQVPHVSYHTPSVYGFGHIKYYENVIKTLRGEAEPKIDGREGLKSLETLIAGYRSAQTGEKVHLPLERQPHQVPA